MRNVDLSNESLREQAKIALHGQLATVWHYTGQQLWEDVIKKEGLKLYDIEFCRGSAAKTDLCDDIQAWSGSRRAIWVWPRVWDELLYGFHVFSRSTGRAKAGVLLRCEVPSDECHVLLTNEYLKLADPLSTYKVTHTLGFSHQTHGLPKLPSDCEHSIPAECVLCDIPPERIVVEAHVNIQVQRVQAHSTAKAQDGLRVEKRHLGF